MRQHLGTRGGHHSIIAASMVMVLMGVENLGDVPSRFFGSLQTLLTVQGIDGQRFTGLRTGNEIVEIAVRVGSPDLFDDHGGSILWEWCKSFLHQFDFISIRINFPCSCRALN